VFVEAFVITQLVEEVITVDDDELSSWYNVSKNTMTLMIFSRQTKEIQTINFTVFLG